MTEEQIKNLKRGDKFIVEYEVTCNEGIFIGVGITHQGKRWTDKMGVLGNRLKTATLVNPTPTFEIGDTVRIVPDPLTGHAHNRIALMDYELGKEYIITEVDKIGGWACIGGPHRVMCLHCLELIKKAVKDKYRVEYDGFSRSVMNEDDFVVANFEEKYHPNAEAAAKAECERLNSEWHKQQEQQGGAE